MNKSESTMGNENVSDLTYLGEIMGGKKHLIKDLIETFLQQVPEEIQSINDAILQSDYKTIRSFAHTMRSDVSMMGINVLAPLLKEMEDLAAGATDIEKIKELNVILNLTCKKAFEELEKEKLNYC